MKSMRSTYKSRKERKYYRELGMIDTTDKSMEELEKLVRKSFEALPSNYQKFVDSKEALIESTTRMAKYEVTNINLYNALVSAVEKNPRYLWHENREKIWKNFQKNYPSLYRTYLSYMRRRGISGTRFWYDNVEFENYGSRVITTLNLETYTGYDIDRAIIFYDELVIEFDYSGDILINAYLN